MNFQTIRGNESLAAIPFQYIQEVYIVCVYLRCTHFCCALILEINQDWTFIDVHQNYVYYVYHDRALYELFGANHVLGWTDSEIFSPFPEPTSSCFNLAPCCYQHWKAHVRREKKTASSPPKKWVKAKLCCNALRKLWPFFLWVFCLKLQPRPGDAYSITTGTLMAFHASVGRNTLNLATAKEIFFRKKSTVDLVRFSAEKCHLYIYIYVSLPKKGASPKIELIIFRFWHY